MKNSDVKNYRFLERAIRISERQIDRIRENSGVADRVCGSDAVFPYVERHISISAPTRTEELHRAEMELLRLIRLKTEIERISKEIPDPVDRQIFRMTMDGKTHEQIGRKVGFNQSTVSRRLSRILAAYCDCDD